MSDRYIPGVPCWIDSLQPDPAAAADFYGALFGWELEDVMPPEAPGRYYMARLPGGDVGAIGSAPEGMSTAVWNTYIWVESADETAAKVREAGGTVLEEPFDVFDAGRMAICADPEGAPFSVWQAGRNRGAARRQRARLAELQRPQHARRRSRREVLRRRVRLGRDRRRRDADVGAARLRRLPRGAHARDAAGRRRDGRAAALHGGGGGRRPDLETTSPTPRRTGA